MGKKLNVRLYDRQHIGRWLEKRGIGTRTEFSEAAYKANKASIDRIYGRCSPASTKGRARFYGKYQRP
jgi:hypothetical protein